MLCGVYSTTIAVAYNRTLYTESLSRIKFIFLYAASSVYLYHIRAMRLCIHTKKSTRESVRRRSNDLLLIMDKIGPGLHIQRRYEYRLLLNFSCLELGMSAKEISNLNVFLFCRTGIFNSMLIYR